MTEDAEERDVFASAEWSMRAAHVLRVLGIRTFAELAATSDETLKTARHCGVVTVREIRFVERAYRTVVPVDAAWEPICKERVMETARLAVPGGWLYRTVDKSSDVYSVALAFVPTRRGA